jgi:hypothetical protein
VALAAGGHFGAIQQQNCTAISTPFDTPLAELSGQLNATYVAYGARREVWASNQSLQDSNAVLQNVATAAQRCQSKASALYDNRHWDLVDACADPKFLLENVRKDDLPPELRGLSFAELRAHVAQKQQQRAELKTRIETIGKQRDAWLQAELQRLGTDGTRRFEQAMLLAVRAQAAARGFVRLEPAPTPAKVVVAPAADTVRPALRRC